MYPSEPVTIFLGVFKVNALDHSAGIFMGPSIQLDVMVSYKRNQGIGEQNGDFSPITLTEAFVMDNDFNDNHSVKNSFL
ncbi:hypothetical protein PU629_03915 [Pullulanibacillus sp. KACC 23026]|uniref:hypothetical protein n=1 Tax=Pullulanibacillus sp. KACC 23026 TaxID=3028315 RepID=UPI0023AF9983|nr:hypothetical protein [Pullulanibacillus sp. KACC 23026]WEG13523.1 hypothetical protein PU629_03915 [Pullulanibacillus sp. KACC 23026]